VHAGRHRDIDEGEEFAELLVEQLPGA